MVGTVDDDDLVTAVQEAGLEAVARQARAHKQAFADYVADLVAAAGLPAALAPQLVLLAEGAMVTAGIFGTDAPAAQARDAAAALIDA